MGKYAEKTTVTVERSRNEIERMLARYGASKFVYGYDEENAMVQFFMSGRLVRFVVELPEENSPEVAWTKTGQERKGAALENALDQALRQRWRAMKLVIQAKLEAVESEITTFDQEFLPHIVLPDGQTVGQYMLPQVVTAYETGVMPKALPG